LRMLRMTQRRNTLMIFWTGGIGTSCQRYEKAYLLTCDLF
jgi:hypothetical protein